jgi:hypothetical protein
MRSNRPSGTTGGRGKGGDDEQRASRQRAGRHPARPAEGGRRGGPRYGSGYSPHGPTPASADDGDPIILGEENVAFSTTQISFQDSGDSMEIFPPEGEVLRIETGYGRFAILANALSGHGIIGGGSNTGVIGGGEVKGVAGHSSTGIGVHGTTEVGTGVKAEVIFDIPEDIAAFEAVGPVRFSTSGLAAVPSSTDRVTVNPGVLVGTQSKVLATLQGNPGNKAMVEHVELNPDADTFQIVLSRAPTRPIQVAWFLIS